MEFTVKTLDQLTPRECHDILQLRVDIFVVEQNCPYSEIDGKDPKCLHIFNAVDGEIASYARMVPPGLSYESEASIGRVVVRDKFRQDRLGVKLMVNAVEATKKQWPNYNIRISAQAHLQHFYNLIGFKTVSEEYLEDNIPHVEMLLEV